MLWVAVIREKRRREYQKETRFTYNGREVDTAKIERFIRGLPNELDLSHRQLDESRIFNSLIFQLI